jgi:hypothetical protein
VDFWAKQENSRDRLVSGAVCGLMGRDGNALFALGDVLGGVVGVEGMRTA